MRPAHLNAATHRPPLLGQWHTPSTSAMGVTKHLIQALPAAVADWDAESRRAKSVERICRSAQGWGGEGMHRANPAQPWALSLFPSQLAFGSRPKSRACERGWWCQKSVFSDEPPMNSIREMTYRQKRTKGSVKMRGNEAQTSSKTCLGI
ncbi:uncharacterized protein LY79DRAFT_558791 [Colletotrichum navitas]|uniref:Uncharacterized protein n=1 Tax=Colletotrichum navitas TaxID=681940 RepID=A0AAD8V1H2_9PEZI|nr:uncharacterized protein LY79DRAFT_558791 [Colletotrichum navitas]KAK1585321.1 hypothetical protein LY79DRAFT_558791 [Colletotrichum navitas]